VYPYCSTQWAKGYTFFFLSLSNIFPRRNDGNSIYTNRILMECLPIATFCKTQRFSGVLEALWELKG
jgi:hypothetical protein